MWRRLLLVSVLTICTPATAQDAREMALAKQELAHLQVLSFHKRREYCGYIGLDAKGHYVTSEIAVGNAASCNAQMPNDIAVVAVIHTHGAFDHKYHNELPSLIDMRQAKHFRFSSYIATPGGRFWYIDGPAGQAKQICGLGCLPAAPGFRVGAEGKIAQHYSHATLAAKLAR